MTSTHVERLVAYLTDGSSDGAVARDLLRWCAESARFRSFADAHRDKIRKKLRGAGASDSVLDVRAELAVAHRLVADRRIEAAFEGYGSTVGGPDFTLTFRGRPAFDLEVTRIRAGASEPAVTGRILGKLRQLRAGTASALLLALDGPTLPRLDLPAADEELRARASAGDDAFFARHALAGTRDFRLRYARLGGVITWAEAGASETHTVLWRNPRARIPLPKPAIDAVVAALGG